MRRRVLHAAPALLALGLGSVAAPSSLAQSGGVSPTAPQAEDTPDVGDSPDAPQPQAEPEAPPAAPMSDASQKARYESYRDVVRSYERELRDAKEQVRGIAERKYNERRASIEERYAKQLKPVVEAERARRVDAIAAFEEFLRRHPSDREFTPDAAFRLAELYFEKYDDEHTQRRDVWKEQYAKWQAGGSAGDSPEEPTPSYPRTVELYNKLINEFADYQHIDGVYYLLGYTLRAQQQTEEGIAAWKTLVTRFPQSRFFPEVWFRIGDQRFDEENWDEAIAAFLNVVPMKESDYYDKALYKLAWTYYLNNRFDDGVQRFFELLDFSYGKRDKGDEQGSVLEDESIQYLAISFGDDNWPRPAQYRRLIAGDSVDDPDSDVETDYVAFTIDYFKDAARKGGPKPYERDVIAKLGDNLFRQSRHVQAIAALEHAIALDPLHKDAPKLQDQVVQAWVRERNFDKANVARDLLVKNYAKGTPWAKKWANDGDALRTSENLARANLYSAALYYHQQATQFFNTDRQDQGVKYFRAASDAYRQYLDRYPHDKNAYELNYYLAETYYYSLRFDEAVAEYERVRDSSQGTKYRAEAGLAAVYSYERILDAAMAANTLEKKEIFAGKRDETVKPQEIPPLRQKYIAAIDKFLERGGDHEMASAFGYRAGEIFYAYGQYDEGVRRFQTVVDRYPDSEAARFAANLILDDLLAKKDWKAAADYAAAFEQKKVGGGDTAEFAKIKGGAQFNIAKETLEDGAKALDEGRISDGMAKLESGADQYLKLLEEDPKREFADVMLYNAALSLEKAKRPARAATLYERLYKEYPDSEYAPEGMFRVASKSEQAFAFDKAVDTYLGLVGRYPKSQRRPDAQINAGLALEGQQKYERAAQEFERFATLFPERPEAPDVFYRAALVHKKRGAQGAELDVLRRFVARYQQNNAQAPRVIEAHTRMAEIYAEQGKSDVKKRKAATEANQAAVKHFARATSSPTAAYFAAKGAFALAEEQFASYAKLGVFSKNANKQLKELEAKSARLQKVEETYKDIITRYKAAEWSLASLYRIGALYDNLQQSVFNSPCPDDVRRLGGDVACDEYRNLIEEQAFVVEEKAVAAYKTAFEKSAELKVKNDWTKRTLEALNLLRPTEYPIDKEPLVKAAPSTTPPSLGPTLPDGGAGELKVLGLEAPKPAAEAAAGGQGT